MIKSSPPAPQAYVVLDRKIADALEKLSQVLRTLAWKQATEQSINPIQLQILIFLLRHPGQQVSISLLADEFNISKASISDTIKLLESKRFIKKEYTPASTRKFTIQLSIEGKELASAGVAFDAAIVSGIGEIDTANKENLFCSLSQLLLHLYRIDVISQQQMCQTCKHYEVKNTLHYCNLLQQYMVITALKLDCPDHLTERSIPHE